MIAYVQETHYNPPPDPDATRPDPRCLITRQSGFTCPHVEEGTADFVGFMTLLS